MSQLKKKINGKDEDMLYIHGCVNYFAQQMLDDLDAIKPSTTKEVLSAYRSAHRTILQNIISLTK